MSFQASHLEPFEEIQTNVMIILTGFSKKYFQQCLAMVDMIGYVYILGGKVHFKG
jgi:hypothetical protein